MELHFLVASKIQAGNKYVLSQDLESLTPSKSECGLY